MSSNITEIPISTTLISSLRSFDHQVHTFKQDFLSKTDEALAAYLRKFGKLHQGAPEDFKRVSLALHYYLAMIDNVDALISMFHEEYHTENVNVKALNSTNIFNVNSILRAIHAFRSSHIKQDIQQSGSGTEENQSSEKGNPKKIELKLIQKFRIQLTQNETKADSVHLSIASELLDFAINSRGRFDMDFISLLCAELNKALDLDLHHFLLAPINHQDLTNGFSKAAHMILETSRGIIYDDATFQNHMRIFTEEKDLSVLLNIVTDLEHTIYYILLRLDHPAQDLLKRLFICLLGHREDAIREKAVLYLNILIDGIEWQLKGGYKTRVAVVGTEFIVSYLLESEPDNENLIFLLYAFPFDNTDEPAIMSWHKPEIISFPDDPKYIVAVVDLGNFPRAGFYDWKFVRLHEGGKMSSVYTGIQGQIEEDMDKSDTLSDLSMDSKDSNLSSSVKVIQGRCVVHPQRAKDMEVHELLGDYPEGIPGEQNRGSFVKIKEELQRYLKAGINCIYLMGALERDHGGIIDEKTGLKKDFKRKDVSPMAVTCRRSLNSLLGGAEEFKELMEAANTKNIDIVIDCVTRISSARYNRRYKDLVLQCVDDDGKLSLAYGGEGRARKYEETVYLNYRRKEAWDMLISESMGLIKQYGISGLYLDDAQTWPQLFEIDEEELMRQDTDGIESYTLEERFYGDVIMRKKFTGYWFTEAKNKYGNPMIVEICRTFWQKFPNLILIGEAWGGQGYEQREVNLIKSGIIPRLYKLPPATAAVFGKHLNKDGSIKDTEALSVNSLRSWYEAMRKTFPFGSIVIQSTTSHSWPSPAYLYKRGAWGFVDLMCFLPHIPMTLMGEMEGHAFKCNTVGRFQTQLKKAVAAPSNRTKRENQVKAIFDAVDELSFPGMIQVERCANTKELYEDFLSSQDHFWREVGPEYGYDLKMIHLHYEHRRQLRKKHEFLKSGKMISLVAEHADGYHSHVLTFARALKKELAIIAINLHDFNVLFGVNMKGLKYIFEDLDKDALEFCVVKIFDHLGDTLDDYYTVYEFLNGKMDMTLKPYSSLIWGAVVITGDKELHAKTMIRSLERMKGRILRNQTLEGNEIVTMLVNLVKEANSVQEFANNLGYIYSHYLRPSGISVPQVLNSIKEFREDFTQSAKLYAFCCLLSEQAPPSKRKVSFKIAEPSRPKMSFDQGMVDLMTVRPKSYSVYATRKNSEGVITYNTNTQEKYHIPEKLLETPEQTIKSIYDFVDQIISHNSIGAIAFITPELGRWSTMGGLGVMVDELSIGLAELGEEIICVSPYYERNRKGESGYLERDPDDIQHIFNIEVSLGDGTHIVGIHYGVVKNVSLYFLHNPFIFPQAYPDGDARFTIQQLSLMAKASLELFCVLKKIPDLIVTNDWFTALVPAYPKHGHFGDIFRQTKFLHIVHNLDTSYEGRMYPNPHEGFLEYIHNLPSYLFVDPYWADRVINPSRCAILASDQWATVSLSYKQELMSSSPLAPILKNHPLPFAFPNGIPKEARFKRILQLCDNDHLKAKGLLQKKYFKRTELDNSAVVFGFVGRITHQKGVHLILENMDQLVKEYGSKIQVLIGGMVNMKDPYGNYCARMMNDLSNKYPENFWAHPTEFFTDGALVNVGADFGLMPSLFEPGGIVQHEFFVGSTPVIAFQTGGLKDTVFEFDAYLEKGNGFVFQIHGGPDLVKAMERAMKVFEEPTKYNILRQNAFESTIDVEDVARAWNREFLRLFNKTFIDPVLTKIYKNTLDKTFKESDYKEVYTLRKVSAEPGLGEKSKTSIYKQQYLKTRGNLRNTVFMYKTNALPKPRNVMLVGSFDDWKEPLPMNFDHIMGRWTVTIPLTPGEYYYKFVVDNRWVCTDDDPKTTDLQGLLNNYIQII